MSDTIAATARSLARDARALPRQRAAVREKLDAIAGKLDVAADAITAGNVRALIEIVKSPSTGGEGSLQLLAGGLRYGPRGSKAIAPALRLARADAILYTGGPANGPQRDQGA